MQVLGNTAKLLRRVGIAIAIACLVLPTLNAQVPIARVPVELPPLSVPVAPTIMPPPLIPGYILPETTILNDTALGPRPLPGSLEDELPRELDARAKFRTLIWDGAILTALPPTLLWESPLASLRDPRMRAIMTNQPNFRTSNSLETSIGGTIGLYRYESSGSSMKFQIDIFGVVHTRLTPEDVTVADYRFGIPFTFQWSDWHGKIAYEHTSGHIGDRLIRATGAQVFSHNKDEVVLGLGRWYNDRFRLYGQMAYAFLDLNPDRVAGPFRADVGFDWYARTATGFNGTPFLAANVEVREDQDYQPNSTIQAGWLWRNPNQRFGSFRIFAEYRRGGSVYGQFYRTQENYAGAGLAFDF